MKSLDVVYDSVFPWKTDDDFQNRTDGVNNTAVVICNEFTIVYNTDGVDDVDKAVKAMVGGLTAGCNYRYEIKKKIGNVYWLQAKAVPWRIY